MPGRAAVTPSQPWTARVRPAHVALALAAIHLVLVVLSLIPRAHDGGDNAVYMALARSLLDDGSYRELWDPAARPHAQFPPGWPLILAGAMAAGVKPWVGFKVVAALFSALAVALAYLWARRAATPGAALAVGAVLAVGAGVVETGRWELSDPPFWAFTMLALWGFARLRQADATEAAPAPADGQDARDASRRWTPGWTAMALAAAGTLLAHATRSAGLPLVVAAAAWLAWRRRWGQLGVLALAIGPFAVFWWARGQAAGAAGYAGFLWYVDPYRPALGTVGVGGMLARVGRNTVEYTTQLLPSLLTGMRVGTAAAVLGTAVVLLALAGWAMRMRRPGVAELWLPLYVALVLVWPGEWADKRFLLPALPVLLVCAGEPVRLLAARTSRPMLAGAAAAGLLVLGAMPALSSQIQHASRCRAELRPGNPFPCLANPWVDFLRMATDLRGNLPADARVLSRKASLFWAHSGYPSRTYPFTNDPDTLLAAAREAGARYVMLDHMDRISVLYLAPALMQRPQAFCVMGTLGADRATLLAILPGAESMPNVRDVPGEEMAYVGFRRCGREFWAPARAPPSD